MPTLTSDKAVRAARLMAGFFIAYLVLLPLILEKLVPVVPQTVDRTLFVAICIVSIAEVGVAIVVRNRNPLVGDEIALQAGWFGGREKVASEEAKAGPSPPSADGAAGFGMTA